MNTLDLVKNNKVMLAIVAKAEQGGLNVLEATSGKIADKVVECVNDLSLYYVLRNNDDGSKSKGQQVLDECVEEARPKIQKKVDEIIENKLNVDWLIEEVVDVFYDELRNQLIGKQ